MLANVRNDKVMNRKAHPIKLGRQPLENVMDHIDLYVKNIYIYIYIYNMHIHIHMIIHMSSDQFHVHSPMHAYSIHTNVLAMYSVLRAPTPYICMYVLPQ